MARYSDSISKLGRFTDRNSGNLLRGLKRELLVKAYKSERIRALSRKFHHPRDPDKWVFLVGCYNSGTTILRDLVESHPDIAGFPVEGVSLTDAFPDLEIGGWPRMMYANKAIWDLPEEGSGARVQMAKSDWSLWWPRAARVFLEKSIDHTVRMPWLDRHFANAHFIFIVRNGYCVCEGIRRRAAPQGEAARKLGTAYPIEMVAAQWIALNEKVEKDSVGIGQFHQIRYEDLTNDPVSEVAAIFEFLDLEIPAMEWSNGTIVLNGRSHQILNQNPASMARINTDDRAALGLTLAPGLERYGYSVLD